ncbi:MAG: peptide-methionine (S)-S-oxide reductase MsrA [Corynebacterium pyruviciproducens]|uniref:peptide-methionine (S)-S-oxide reductase MsrA n=1 Tax=Corynebacterium pyruviciproducens TaxID=598660 RepID=UPI0039834977
MLFNEPIMPTPDTALKGGKSPVLPTPGTHAVLGTPLNSPGPYVLFGLGCFWGAEKLFWLVDGVITTSVGFAGGYTHNPTYREVCTGRTGHAEVVKVVYDPQKVSFEQLVKIALEAHDPTQGFRQGNDVGTQYRSCIFTETDEQAEIARRIATAYAAKLKEAGYGDLTTEIRAHVDYYLAEEEHQQYLHKNPGGYCPVHATGIACG